MISSDERDESWVCSYERTNSTDTSVEYEVLSCFLYFEEPRIAWFSRERFYEDVTKNEPTLLETQFIEFQPPATGVTITNIAKDEKHYFLKDVKDTNNNSQSGSMLSKTWIYQRHVSF